MKRTIAIDFDGVIHKYSKGWQDGSIYDEPIEGAFEAIRKFEDMGFRIVVFTARPAEQRLEILMWLMDHAADQGIVLKDLTVSNHKPMAVVYIDDRGVHFRNWKQTVQETVLRIRIEQNKLN